ncbi:virulence factor Mce-like protein [Halopolyspora algeriensis]|uniref:Virulence factor Mce-like protein n=1 Tax=Halopolyspora algeriensis TaxID=1500506 RepID=A0A368VS11_9ACTN|nr:MCE family protein [Halopolyspora algeriensis]RCW44531.1 virulence factor Mce-like protein [Halopolyspora algeriensis]TQM55891.1 virulence factor Mce-like protein [Halopolyspora algeriensis]
MNRRFYGGRRYYQLLGVAFLVVAAVFFAATIGVYRKAFTPVVAVTLKTDHVGTQMSVGADVKARGVIVGEVSNIEASAGHATMRLALQPDKVDMLPADVSARLLPKTLFGERYVALQIPEKAGGAHLEAGDVIGKDRSAAAIEIEKVLGELMPLLQAVQPQKMALTLNAVSQALQGRGEQLGDTLVRMDAYLEKLNPALPELQEVLGRLDDVSDTYARAAPDALQALSDLTTTTKTVVEQRKRIQGMLTTLTTTSVNTTRFLETNRQNLIRLAGTSRSTLELFAKYAPQYPCMLAQIADSIPTAQHVFGKGTDNPHIQKVTIEVADGHHKYVPGLDDPQYLDQRGPRCYEQAQYPETFPQHPPGGPIKDGSRKSVSSDEDDETPSSTADPAGTAPQFAAGSSAGVPELANSPAEQRFLAALLAPSLGTAPSEVPGWSSLLVGPLFRGAEVTAR